MVCARSATMLRVDFVAPAWRHHGMDEINDEQIRALLTRVGMIMEEASSSALMLKPADVTFVDRLDALARAIDGAGILLRAAAVLYADGR